VTLPVRSGADYEIMLDGGERKQATEAVRVLEIVEPLMDESLSSGPLAVVRWFHETGVEDDSGMDEYVLRAQGHFAEVIAVASLCPPLPLFHACTARCVVPDGARRVQHDVRGANDRWVMNHFAFNDIYRQ
jgi:hypothetical protein